MFDIKIVNKIYKNVDVKKIQPNLMQLIFSGEVPEIPQRFKILRKDMVLGEYTDFTTKYLELEKGYILSNDGSVYVEPSEPEPIEPPEPTLEEVQEAKVEEMNRTQQMIIEAGVQVELSTGSEHFTLTQHDQQSLMALQSQVLLGIPKIAWHSSDQSKHCEYYSTEDMEKIVEAALGTVTFHVTYFRDLRIYIRELSSIEDVEQITYGVVIPKKSRSQVLDDLYRGLGIA
ncbi:hypothetical protein LJC51_09010 [Lachnospiraceae bacterium OttesenSCG-928-J05]|nr:hypothetical protein [Lachnospiraceae bacterium OttesenSCG-928-J05]